MGAPYTGWIVCHHAPLPYVWMSESRTSSARQPAVSQLGCASIPWKRHHTSSSVTHAP